MPSSKSRAISYVYLRCKCDECKTIEGILEDLVLPNNNSALNGSMLAQRVQIFDEISE